MIGLYNFLIGLRKYFRNNCEIICSNLGGRRFFMMKVKGVKEIENTLVSICKKEIEQCSYEELYTALLGITEEESKKRARSVEGRKLYYISAEFLIGKLLSNCR